MEVGKESKRERIDDNTLKRVDVVGSFEKNIEPLVTKSRAVIFTVLWVVGSLLSILAMTDLFEETPFKKKYTFFLLMIAVNTIFMARIWKIYFNKKARN